jgi:hypothetical protein
VKIPTHVRFMKDGIFMPITDYRKDGWPLCPRCDDDELAAIWTLTDITLMDIDFCYRRGRVEVSAP